MAKYHLSPHQLDKVISTEHVWEVSRIIYESLGLELGLTKTDIHDPWPHDWPHKMLRIWKRKFAEKATYRTLIEALLRCNRRDDAQKVCELLAESKQRGMNIDVL